MTEKQYLKLESTFRMRNCPACNQQSIYCYKNLVNLFNSSRNGEDYRNVEIPDADYIDFECPNCGLVMEFNLKKIFG